ncbi:hypothetical protein Golax_012310, partial [Gossypium laxum]|nr:hypothetical protein [Gossypium laxum]
MDQLIVMDRQSVLFEIHMKIGYMDLEDSLGGDPQLILNC